MMHVSDESRLNNNIANNNASNTTDYKAKYQNLKRRLKILLYENESYQEDLRKAQRQLLQVTRDKNFLLDRLLQYEQIDSTSSDSDSTESSDSDHDGSNKLNETQQQQQQQQPNKRKRPSESQSNQLFESSLASNATATTTKKKKPNSTPNVSRGKNNANAASKGGKTNVHITTTTQTQAMTVNAITTPTSISVAPVIKEEALSTVAFQKCTVTAKDGPLTSEELEKHFESRPIEPLFVPEKTPLTLPVELFSESSSAPDNNNSTLQM